VLADLANGEIYVVAEEGEEAYCDQQENEWEELAGGC
jgi:hypothetical protein